MSRSLVITREFLFSPSEIFDAWTRPDRVRYWLAPKPSWSTSFSNTASTGGPCHLEMINPDGLNHTVEGHYLQLVSNQRIAMTWRSIVVPQSVVLIELTPSVNGTTLTLSHDGLTNSEVIQHHLSGWTGCLNQLGAHLQASQIEFPTPPTHP